VPGTPRLPEFDGALQGRNSKGTTGYFGPRPPKADAAHHYHFQVFAVDTILPLDPAASPSQVLAALNGHVVGVGEVVATFKRHTEVDEYRTKHLRQRSGDARGRLIERIDEAG
jgi:phosphatidylethanolamine-binding protein (PEBP) family uncharacterized protein